MRSVTLSDSNGVRPRRKSAAIDSGRCSSRLSSCSTLNPVIAPWRAVRLAVPARVRVSAMHAVAEALDRERQVALAFEPAQAEQLAEAGFEVDVGELQLRFDIGALGALRQDHGALERPAEGLRFADRDA